MCFALSRRIEDDAFIYEWPARLREFRQGLKPNVGVPLMSEPAWGRQAKAPTSKKHFENGINSLCLQSEVSLLREGFEEVDYGDGFFAAFLGVGHQRDAMRAFGGGEIGEGGEHGLDDIEAAEHGGVEDVHSGAAGNQEQGDVFAAHVTGAAESGFPVAPAPIPGGVEQAGLLGEEGFCAVEVHVAGADEGFD